MKVGEIKECDVHHDPEWRCLVAGCSEYGVWFVHAWPQDRLSAHYRTFHEVLT